MKKNVKFWLSLIGLAILGFVFGIMSSYFSLDHIVFDFFNGLGSFVNKNIFIIYLVSIFLIDLASLILYRLGKKDIELSLKEDEGLVNDKKLSVSISLNSISVIIAIILYFTYGANLKKLETSLGEDLFALFLLIAHVFYFAYMQKLQVEFLKTYNPSKYDNVLDMKFQEKYMKSLDEREVFESYKSGFRAYRSMMMTIFILIIVLGIVSIGSGLSLLSLYVLGLVALVGTLAYLLEAIRS